MRLGTRFSLVKDANKISSSCQVNTKAHLIPDLNLNSGLASDKNEGSLDHGMGEVYWKGPPTTSRVACSIYEIKKWKISEGEVVGANLKS